MLSGRCQPQTSICSRGLLLYIIIVLQCPFLWRLKEKYIFMKNLKGASLLVIDSTTPVKPMKTAVLCGQKGAF